MSAYLYDGLRTPFGRHAGALAPVRPDDLLAGVIRAVIARGPFEPGDVEDVIVGCTNQAGEDSRNVARHAALLAGLPIEVSGLTVNRLCGSGLAAVLDAACAATAGQGELFIAGGVESMSRAPFDARTYDTTMGARFPNPRLIAGFGDDTMPQTADNIEINEAFAVQVLGCLKLLELAEDDSRVNPNGGAIAVGHPLGASGARLALTAARQLQVSGGRYALVSMCIGVGQGIAAIPERV